MNKASVTRKLIGSF